MRQGNRCGACHVCCNELENGAKPAFQPCEHLGEEGCNIYEDRPLTCRLFQCMWMMDSWPRKLRPDRAGVVAHWTTNKLGGLGINVVEVHRGALEKQEKIVQLCAKHACRLIECSYMDGARRLISRDPVFLQDMRELNKELEIPSAIDWKVEQVQLR